MSKDINNLIAEQVAAEVAKRLDVGAIATTIVKKIDVNKIANGCTETLVNSTKEAAKNLTVDFDGNLYVDVDGLSCTLTEVVEKQLKDAFFPAEKKAKKNRSPLNY